METNDGSLDYAEGLKLTPISHKEKAQLEKELEREICPLTVEARIEEAFGIYINGMTKLNYLCAVSRGMAEGGATGYDMTARTPCSMGYAKTCPLYIRRKEETTFKNRE